MSIYTKILRSVKHDKRHLDRYINFMTFCERYNNKNTKQEVYVAHHICPREMFPEYESFGKNPWNRIYLTERQHFIAHIMLWKVYGNKSMTFAANMLSNFQGIRYTSRLYERLRLDFRKSISETNKGSKRSEEQKKQMSENRKNSLVVYDIRDPNKTRFRINKNDDDYDPSIHIFYRSGTTHTKETRKKIGRAGKRAFHCPETNKTIFIMPGDKIPNGYISGYPNGVIKSEHVKNSVWAFNPKTKDNIRVKEGEKLPCGYVFGRYMPVNKGFEKANSMKRVVNLRDRKVECVEEINQSFHGPESGQSTSNTVVYTFANKIFTNKKILVEFAKDMGYNISRRNQNDSFENHVIKTGTYSGMRYYEVGIRTYKLNEFQLNEHLDKEIVWKPNSNTKP